MSAWRRVPGGVDLFLRVTPNAGRNVVAGVEPRGNAEVLRVKVAAAPDKGRANAALVKLIAGELRLRPSAIAVVSGEAGRNKRLRIEADPESIDAALRRLAELV